MKRKLVASILGITASLVAVTSSYGQGFVNFENYASTSAGGPVVYGAGSDGPVGTGVQHGYQAQLWYGLGNLTNSVSADPSGVANPSDLGAFGLLAGIIAPFAEFPLGTPQPLFNGFFSYGDVQIPDYVSGDITFMIVAFNGADYQSALYRGHSAAWAQTIAGQGLPVGGFEGLTGFGVFIVPEPSTFALAGLGAAALLIFRRRK